MARRHTSILASIGMLSIGLAIGGHLETTRLTQSARAVSEEAGYETRIPAHAAALVESGNHISDIFRRSVWKRNVRSKRLVPVC